MGYRVLLATAPVAALLTAVCAGQAITTPEAHLGRPVGVDFQLADWEEVSGYFGRLALESPRVTTSTIGTSTEGRPFLLSVISSAANLARLEEIREHAAILADPRGRSDEQLERAVAEGKVILMMSIAMHSTETAAPQFGLEFAYQLATSDEEPWVSARDEVVVCIFPCLNPDGLDHVVSWYRETVGTPYEGSDLLKLYQLYAGHDNNRDWFMLTQVETRLVTEQLYKVWHPQVYWDIHQQGSRRERMFVPPFRDPLNPNLDPAIIAGIDAIGSRALLDMTREGLTGISTGVSYDMWWNGGNRNVPVRHNIIGLLTEAASVRFASPIFVSRRELAGPRGLDGYRPSNRFPAPWPGGWWRLRHIIDYEMSFGRSLLGSLSREPETWLHNALGASRRSIEAGAQDAPRGWIFPATSRDPAAVRRLCDVLLQSGVELHVAQVSFHADGRGYPAGSILIRREQPYGDHVKDLLEVQRYPEGQPPYDVAGWTLPLLLGVHRVEVIEDALDNGTFDRVLTADDAVAALAGDRRVDEAVNIHSSRDTTAWTRVVARVNLDRPMSFVAGGDRSGLFLDGVDLDVGEGETHVALRRVPRIGVYAPWRGSMDEGWTRYVFDTFGIPYIRVRNEMLRAGDLDGFLDVLVIPSISPGSLDRGRPDGSVPAEYLGGLAPEGAIAVEEFVRGGGTVVAFASATDWIVDLLKLPLVDVTTEEVNREFSCPGSVLRGVPIAGNAFTADLQPSLSIFYSRDCAAWRTMTDDERRTAEIPKDGPAVEMLLRYAPTRVLLSGWIRKPEAIAGETAWARAAYGDGQVHIFGFRPQFRGWTQATFQLIFRAMLFDGQGEGPEG